MTLGYWQPLFIAVSLLIPARSSVVALTKGPGCDDVCLTSECVQAAGSLLSYMNPEADPCEDFYDFACGRFKYEHAIPVGRSNFEQFGRAKRIIQQNLRILLGDSSTGSPPVARTKAKNLYKACMDTDRIAQTALSWARQLVERLGGLALHSDDRISVNWSLSDSLLSMSTYATNRDFGPMRIFVAPDARDVLTNVITLQETGLGIRSRDFYLNKTLDDPILSAYANMLQSFAELVSAEGRVERRFVEDVVNFELKLAAILRPLHELANIPNMYYKRDVKWLQLQAPFMSWLDFLNDLFSPVGFELTQDTTILIYDAPYFQDLYWLLRQYLSSEAGKRTLQNYVVLRTITMYSSTLGGDFQGALGKVETLLTGLQGLSDRWQTCVDEINAKVGFAVGAMYIEKHFPARDRRQIETLTRNVVSAFRDRIKAASWMDNETRSGALEKIEYLSFGFAHPDWQLNETYLNEYYEDLQVTDDYIENDKLAINFEATRGLRGIHHDPDLTEWPKPPQEVNAFYAALMNRIFIHAGILQRPFYYSAIGMPEVLNYGAIGSVVGHEVTHGFDSLGKEFDSLGNMRNWWTNSTRAQFEEKARCIVEKYSGYKYGEWRLRGELTLGEDIADDGGVKAAYEAFSKARSEGRIGPIRRIVGSNFTEEQLFFLAFAQQWCSIGTEQSILFRIMTDVHSFAKYRVIGTLSNNGEFARAFDCPVGSTMNPPEKCEVW